MQATRRAPYDRLWALCAPWLLGAGPSVRSLQAGQGTRGGAVGRSPGSACAARLSEIGGGRAA